MKDVKIKENIYWVGGIDWNLRSFHGYVTHRGTTYNSYLVIDEKITLIDTVKSYLSQDMIDRISSIIDPAKIDYIISNHAEMDHSGALPELIKIAPNAEIIATPNGEKILQDHFGKNLKCRTVKTGDSLSTGKYNFKFFPTPMIHWPDNMVTYLEEEKILFSNDAFGQHLATSERFDDQYNINIIIEEARKYYANIVLPYSAQVQKALSDIAGLKIEIIAPSHGIIWRKNLELIMDEYQKWSSGVLMKRALIVYDTMWNSTEIIAKSIEAVFEDRGYSVKMYNLQHNHESDIMTELLEAEYICVGSPTLNNNMLPSVASFLTYMKGLAPKGRKALAFGSFGWGGQSVKQVHEILEGCNYLMLDQISIKFRPDEDILKGFMEKLKESIS
ncbi:MAG: FprA family A-type flavoprotein [Leptospirales bacterium]|nr:FprA family A-type flavoprotein [Leptospirales bacterium]